MQTNQDKLREAIKLVLELIRDVQDKEAKYKLVLAHNKLIEVMLK